MSGDEANAQQPHAGQLSDYLSLGVIARIYRRDLVDDVLLETRSKEKRQRLLPARLVVYYVIALALFFGEAYEEVMRKTAADFLRRLIEAVPCKVHIVLTDNGTHFIRSRRRNMVPS